MIPDQRDTGIGLDDMFSAVLGIEKAAAGHARGSRGEGALGHILDD
jgi:hypothetical protein